MTGGLACPACGARNPADARWCNLCLVSLGPGADEPAPSPAAPSPAAPSPAAPPDDGQVGDASVRLRDDELEWACTACGAWSPMIARDCVTCGAARRGFVPDEPADADHRRSAAVHPLAIAVPGLAHLLLGARGAGLARLAVWALWLGGGVLLITGGARLVGGLLVVAALGLWTVTVLEVPRLQRGAGGLLTPRALAWLVVAVTVVLALVTTAAAVLTSTAGGAGSS